MRKGECLFFLLLTGCALVGIPARSPSPVKGIWEITADRSGRIWFVETVTQKIGVLDPKRGRVERYDLPPGVHPRGIAVDSQGIIWTTTADPGGVVRFDPTRKEARVFDLPPGNSLVSAIAVDRQDTIWFTVASPGRVGRLDRESLRISLHDIPTPRSLPEDIAVDGKGNVWFTENASHTLGRFNSVTLGFEEFPIPFDPALPERIAVDGEGVVWFVGAMGEVWVRFDPQEKRFFFSPAPPKQDLSDVAVDGIDAVWFTDSGLGLLKRVDSRTGQVDNFPTPTIDGGPRGIAIDLEKNLYFVEYRTNRIIRFTPGSETGPENRSGSFVGFEVR